MPARRIAIAASFGIAVLSGGQPAMARSAGGAPGFFSHPFVPHGFFGRGFTAHRGAFFHQRFPFGLRHFGPGTTAFAWPTAPFTDWAPIQSPAAEPVRPEVIVLPVSGAASGAAAPQQTAAAAPLDFSYVAGCHAIPNGYHCDTPPGASDLKPRNTQMNTD